MCLIGTEAKGWYGATKQISGHFGVKIDAYRVGPDGDFIDDENCWREVYQANANSVVLIRPDGFVCWRADSKIEQPELVLRDVFIRILGL